MRSVLYITYDGLTDALGQSQILAYLRRLAKKDNHIVVLSFEKKEAFKKEGDLVRQMVEESGLIWVPLTYTKKPPVVSTIYDLYRGYKQCKKLHQQYRFDIAHCRGYISAILGSKLQQRYGVKFIFDMRGWWPDEKLESGLWDNKVFKPVYRYFKELERKFFRLCDFAVSLTYKGKEEIVKQGLAEEMKIGVIPTCVDFSVFQKPELHKRDSVRSSLEIKPGEKVFVYSGSVGGNYDPNIIISVYKRYQSRFPDSFLLILSKDNIDERTRALFTNAGITRIKIINASFREVSGYLCASDVGFIYYKPSFSTIGRSPTKMGEYWASGLPVIGFKGIGDLDSIFKQYPGCGTLLSQDEQQWQSDINDLPLTAPDVLREYAYDYFHVDKGVAFYQSTYEKLTSSPDAPQHFT